MIALSDAINRGAIPNSEIVLSSVTNPMPRVSSQLKRRGHETLAIERKGLSVKNTKTGSSRLSKNHEVDLICLAGYMRLLSPCFIDAVPHRILNIHPSLLPRFPVSIAQQQAIKHGVKSADALCTLSTTRLMVVP